MVHVAPEPSVAAVRRGRWLVFGATVFWAGSATLARHVFRDRHVDPLVAVETRLGIATVVLFAFLVAFRPKLLRVRRADLPYLMTLGLVGVATMQASYFHAIAHLGPSLAILLQYLAPSLLVGFELVRGRPVRRPLLAAVPGALAGTTLLVGGVDPKALRAGAFEWSVGVSSAFAFAFYIQYSKRGLAQYAAPTVLFYTFLVAAGFWAVREPPWKIFAAGYGTDVWLAFVALGLFSTLVPFSLFAAGLRALAPAEASVIATSEPVLVIAFASVLLGERLGPLQLVGAALVLGAALLSTTGGEAAAVPQD